jgi:hypothetical protein
MNITIEEWYEWKQSTVTRELLKALQENRAARLEEIAHGHANGLEQIYIEIGRVQGIEDALQFLVSDVKDELIEDKEIENEL